MSPSTFVAAHRLGYIEDFTGQPRLDPSRLHSTVLARLAKGTKTEGDQTGPKESCRIERPQLIKTSLLLSRRCTPGNSRLTSNTSPKPACQAASASRRITPTAALSPRPPSRCFFFSIHPLTDGSLIHRNAEKYIHLRVRRWPRLLKVNLPWCIPLERSLRFNPIALR